MRPGCSPTKKARAHLLRARVHVVYAVAIKPLIHAPGRALLTILVIALGVALAFAIYLIQRSAADEVTLASNHLFGSADLVVQATSGGFDEALYPIVARTAGVALASPVVEVTARLIGRDTSLKLMGVDAFRVSRMQPELGFGDRDSSVATFGDDAIFLSAAAAAKLGIGKGAAFAVQMGLQRIELRVADVLPAAAYSDLVAVLDIATAQWKFHQLGVLQRIDLQLVRGAQLQEVQSRLQALVPPGVRVTTPAHRAAEALSFSRAYRANLLALASVALFTGGFLIYAVQSLATLRRTREFALLRAIGVTGRQQSLLVFIGGGALGGFGAAAGVVLGALLGKVGLRLMAGELNGGTAPPLATVLHVHAWEAGAFFLLGVAVAVGATVRSALQAGRVEPAMALKGGDLHLASQSGHGWIALGFWAVGGMLCALPAVAEVPVFGYISIACMLLGAVAAMPSTTRAVLRALPRTPKFVAWNIAHARLRATAQHATLSVAAILVSVSLMVAMAIMVDSFRHSLDDWLAKLMPADIYLRSGSARESSFFDSAAIDALRRVSAVRNIEISRSVDVSLDSGQPPVTLLARPVTETSARQLLWLRSESRIRAPAGAIAVWISETAADRFSIPLDGTFELPLAQRYVRCAVRGVFRDYDRPTGAVVMDYATYVELTADTAVNGISVWVRDRTRTIEAAGIIRAALPASVDFDLRLPGEIRSRALAIFDSTFAVTYLLEIVAVLIGLVGIGASMSTEVLARRAEFGVLRHLGLLRRQIAALLALEGAGLGAAGVLFGVSAGFVISLILIYVVNRQSFHWSMDLHVPVLTIVILSGSLTAAAAVAAVWSGRSAMSGDVVAAVKEDW